MQETERKGRTDNIRNLLHTLQGVPALYRLSDDHLFLLISYLLNSDILGMELLTSHDLWKRASGYGGIAVSEAQDRLFVANYCNDQIAAYSIPDGQLLASWGGRGDPIGCFRFSRESGLGVLGNELFVADTWNLRVQVFAFNGRFLRSWKLMNNAIPRALATSEKEILITTEAERPYFGDGSMQVFSPLGNFVSRWSSRGNKAGQCISPVGIYVDTLANKIFVADPSNNRIQIFSHDTHAFLHEFPVYQPQGVVARNDKMYVSTKSSIVVLSTSTGKCIWSWKCPMEDEIRALALSDQYLFVRAVTGKGVYILT